MGALKKWFMKVKLRKVYILGAIFDAETLSFEGSKNTNVSEFSVAQAELEAASSNSIALSLQQMNDIRQTLVNTLVKSLFFLGGGEQGESFGALKECSQRSDK